MRGPAACLSSEQVLGGSALCEEQKQKLLHYNELWILWPSLLGMEENKTVELSRDPLQFTRNVHNINSAHLYYKKRKAVEILEALH